MSQAILIIPTGPEVGLTTIAVGLVHALDRRGVRVGFCKPIARPHEGASGTDRSSRMVELASGFVPPVPITAGEADAWFATGQRERLLEEVVARFSDASARAEVILVEGLVASPEQPYADVLNARLASALDADVILVTAPHGRTPDELTRALNLAAQALGATERERILGCILNQVGAPPEAKKFLRWAEAESSESPTGPRVDSADKLGEFTVLGSVPWDRDLLAPRVSDVQRFLGATFLAEGDTSRRVTDVALGASTAVHAAQRLLPGTLFITSGDRDDLVMAASLAVLGGRGIAALLLTNGRRPSASTLELCKPGLETGLPVLLMLDDSFRAALKLREMNLEVALDDAERIGLLQAHVAAGLDMDALELLTKAPVSGRRLSPPAFRYRLVEQARAAQKRIVLPEGTEPRTLQAAFTCAERGIARCVLLGGVQEVRAAAARIGLTLPESVEIVEPEEARARFVTPLVALRKHKGLNEPMAEEALLDNVMLGTMMLQQGEVDGLVSGAVHTTANTIRPALQVIKVRPDAKLVSSVFFMCLPEQVLVYGDCAINPDPDPAELADIALQSAATAEAFGIPARVAMLSYSTGGSGSGSDVDKVREATRLARAGRPDLLIDGPLQYDAAADPGVAKSKAPDSPVAGRATVFIFPDLNTGNTTYKAVQRSAEVVSIGPMLQGLNKPVNDLSRGALVEDIVYTIALTAIQAQKIG